jgi:hypothetical protein
MADIIHDPRIADAELREHQRTFASFSKLVLFSVLHVVLVLGCLALAFVGNASLFALVLGVGGTIALLVAFSVMP